MCGRFVVARSVSDLVSIFEVDEVIGDVPGVSYNVAPTQDIAIIVDRSFEKAEDGSNFINFEKNDLGYTKLLAILEKKLNQKNKTQDFSNTWNNFKSSFILIFNISFLM